MINTGERRRARILIHGAVQGVGFRPFVYRLACEHQLDGWVGNTPQGVIIDVEGSGEAIAAFSRLIPQRKPVIAQIHSFESVDLPPSGQTGFEIRESGHDGASTAVVMPDLAPCPDCLKEIFDPADRRYRYPFTNCTNCGPRFTIIEALPYDRPNTSMRGFTQCPACQREYEDPANRRFHAQPNACPECGPRVALWDGRGSTIASGWDAVVHSATLLRDGKILALKGVGGFHLLCDAANGTAVRELRHRKRREEKPFALLMPSIASVRQFTRLSEAEAQLLNSTAAPIVLVERSEASGVFADAVPGDNPFLGVMLPSTPLHHLLMQLMDRPVIATSGNLADEPICTNEHEALQRLGSVADAFCVHDRPILRHVDDSIARVLLGREQVLRRARGYAPLPLWFDRSMPPTLAVGAHLKNSVAIAADHRMVIGQHIGDLETPEASDAFERAARDLPILHGIAPQVIVCDLHPDYRSSRYARAQSSSPIEVQHHLAHIAACMAENDLPAPVLGISWDGTGLGTDGTIWGGEFLLVETDQWRRVASLRPFLLPGGEAAVKEPRRSALAILLELLGPEALERLDCPTVAAFDPAERRPLRQMVEHGIRSPITTSAGRLFDAVASIVGIRQRVRHEGQAAMQLEWAARASTDGGAYEMPLRTDDGPGRLDWGPMILSILADIDHRVPARDIARRFHTTLAAGMTAVADWVGTDAVALSGGCFQNGLLTEFAVHRLTASGHRVFWHQRIPPNDGGISAGQVIAAALRLTEAPHQPAQESLA